MNKTGKLSVDTGQMHPETAETLNIMEVPAIAISEPR